IVLMSFLLFVHL
ncbi:hypothetical protein D044_3658B, partial [Vibrio parahaemolyticus EKP-026]